MSKHAYLIIAHNDPHHLQSLIEAIDDSRNDIYIHIDKKTNISAFKSIEYKKSKIVFVNDRVRVYWGDPSQIDAEYTLFRCIEGKKYSRIHLISGSDYPLKSQDYIHDFFDKHEEEEFIDFEEYDKLDSELRKKMRLYNFFLHLISHRNRIVSIGSNFFRRVLLVMQMIVGVKRHYTFDEIKKGSNWVSVTQKFVDELLKDEMEIKRQYRKTHCSDEIYKQTIAWSTAFKDRISPMGNLRLIDFTRGNGKNPHIFNDDDFQLLIDSDMLFARKFSSLESGNLVCRLRRTLLNR